MDDSLSRTQWYALGGLTLASFLTLTILSIALLRNDYSLTQVISGNVLTGMVLIAVWGIVIRRQLTHADISRISTSIWYVVYLPIYYCIFGLTTTGFGNTVSQVLNGICAVNVPFLTGVLIARVGLHLFADAPFAGPVVFPSPMLTMTVVPVLIGVIGGLLAIRLSPILASPGWSKFELFFLWLFTTIMVTICMCIEIGGHMSDLMRSFLSALQTALLATTAIFVLNLILHFHRLILQIKEANMIRAAMNSSKKSLR